MKTVFALTLTCVVCLGCQSAGQREAGSPFSSATPAANAPAAEAALANNQAAENADSPRVSGLATTAGAIGKIWNSVGFQRPPAPEPAPVSPEVARFQGFIGTLTTQTSQLSINDPPAVTRQKAEGILATLRDWDSVLAAGRSTGLINDATADVMTRSVQRLYGETQKLAQYAPQPATIDAVKQIGGSLGAVYSSVQGIWAQGSTVSQALLGGTPR